MTQQVRRARKFVRGRRFLTAAAITMVVVGLGVFAGTSFLAHAAGVNGDATCGYSTPAAGQGFTEPTVMQWAQVNGTDPSSATFAVFGTDENSILLGVNTPVTPYPGGTNAHAHPGNGGDATQHDLAGRPYYPALYITPVSGPGNWTKPGDAVPQASGDWQNGGAVWNNPSTGPYVDDVFGVWVTGTQTSNPHAAPGSVGNLANPPALSTGTSNTSLTLKVALTKTVTSGDSIVVAGSGKTITFVASATVSSGTTIPIVAKRSNIVYPDGSTVTDTTAGTGNYTRVTTLPGTKDGWTLGGGDVPTATGGFAGLSLDGYGSEFRWNINGLRDPNNADPATNKLAPGQWYKVQVLDHDGDQNKGGDSGEFCTLIKIPGPPGLKTDPTGGTDIGGPNVDSTTLKQWIGTSIKDTAFLSAKSGFGNVTGSVAFHLFFVPDGTTLAHTSDACTSTYEIPNASDATKPFDTQTLDATNDPSLATSTTYDTSQKGFGKYYWQDVFTPGGANASSYTSVTETCGSQIDQMVDARVRLTPHSAFNIVGNDHVLSAFVEITTDGSSFSPVSGAPVTTSLSPNTTSATYVGSSSCTTSVHVGPTPPAGTYCQVTITDDIAETVLVNASSTFTATGVSGGVNGDDSITRSTDNKAACEADNVSGVTNGPSCEAVKHWINPTTTLHVTDTLVGLTGNVGGSVTYTAYTGTDDATVLAACQAGTAGTGTDETVSGSNPFNGATAPDSSSVDVPDGTVVYFTATYTGNLGTFTSDCTEKASSG